MSTNIAVTSNVRASARALESALYLGLAAGLIGHIFFVQGTVEYVNSALVLLGAAFGFLASWGITPIANALGAVARNSRTADIFPFTGRPTEKARNPADSRRAA